MNSEHLRTLIDEAIKIYSNKETHWCKDALEIQNELGHAMCLTQCLLEAGVLVPETENWHKSNRASYFRLLEAYVQKEHNSMDMYDSVNEGGKSCCSSERHD